MFATRFQKAFRENIKRVDIENYNICNRKCSTCPQSMGIRGRHIKLFEQELFKKLLFELSSCDYENTIAIGRYHEPLLCFELTLDRIQSIRQILPNVTIILNTNGDFVSIEKIKRLADIGLTELKIMRYQSDAYSTKLAINLCTDLAKKLNKKILRRNIIRGENCYFQLEDEGHLTISVRSENYHSFLHGNYRGGLLPQLKGALRSTPCFVTKHSIDIDYNGLVMPCCNMISDSPHHKPFILGDLREQTIYEIYYNSQQSEFTKQLQKGMFDLLETCKYCTYNFGDSIKDSMVDIL